MPTTSHNFSGVGQGFLGPQGSFSVQSAPPDTNGSVGPNHYLQVVNTDFAIFNKSGAAIYGPVPINTLWSGFGGGCETNNDGDPEVLFDRQADRWVISQFSVSTTPYLECVAVSQTSDPTGAYYRYSFNYGTSDFPDYPKMASWPDAYYVSFNMFAGGSTFSGGEVCAYDRAKMLAGAPATQQCFSVGSNYGGLLPADLDGATSPPAGSPNYVLALGASANQLAFWKFHVDWNTPGNSRLTGPTSIATGAFSEACAGGGTCIPQPGTPQQLDSLADRLMFRLAYRNFGDHESLVANHSVAAGSSTGVRWYEIRSPGTTPVIFQQGTFAPDSNFRWMGSIAMDQSGNMALGYSISGSGLYPSIRYTGRLATDALGTMGQGEGTIISGGGAQSGTNGLTRWGDYSAMAVDPSDDCTFWYTNEYIPSTGEFNWATRVGSFKFPGCGAGPQAQSITFGALSDKPYGAAAFDVSATASSGLAVSFNSQTTGVCTVSGSTVTLVAVGTCTIQATQGGNSNWLPAAAVNQSFQVTQGSQTITFGPLADKTYGDAPFAIGATDSAGLTVSFASTTTAVCTVSGNTVTIVSGGTCSITASQSGNANYSAAAPVSRSFNVNRATPVVTWAQPAAIVFGSALGSAQLNATASVPGTFVYTPPAGTVLPVGTGQTLSVTFTPAAAGNYNAVSTSTTIDVQAAPPGPVSGAPKLVLTQTLTRDSQSQVVVTVTIANNGTGAASNVVLSTAKIGATAGTPLPQSLGSVAAGTTIQTTVTFPASVGGSGAASSLSLAGTYTGGNFSSGLRITLP
jgi:hypothetical protein